MFTNNPHEAKLSSTVHLEYCVFTPVPKHIGFVAGRVLFGSGDPAGTVGIVNYVSLNDPDGDTESGSSIVQRVGIGDCEKALRLPKSSAS